MPVQVLTAQEREAWSQFPEAVEEDALGAFFTLTNAESLQIRRVYGDPNRLSLAVQVGALRWLGFIPNDLWSAPERAVAYLAEQLAVPAEALSDYRASARRRGEHGRRCGSHGSGQRLAMISGGCIGGCCSERLSTTRRLPCYWTRVAGCGPSRSSGPV